MKTFPSATSALLRKHAEAHLQVLLGAASRSVGPECLPLHYPYYNAPGVAAR